MKKFVFLAALGMTVMSAATAEAQFSGGRLFKGKAEHKCWSRDYAGYTCQVTGNNFNDCSEAAYRLKMNSCCKTMWLNGRQLTDGVSTEFRMISCSMF